jgi:hypothetical protein
VLCKKLDGQGKEHWWKNYMILCRRHESAKHKSGKRFYISTHIIDKLLNFEPVNKRICKSRVKFNYYN